MVQRWGFRLRSK